MGDSSRSNFSEAEKLTGMINYSDWATRAKLLLQDRECWEEVIVNPVDVNTLAGAAKKDLMKRVIRAMALLAQTVTSIIMPAIRSHDGDPKGLWDYLKQRYEPQATQRKMLLIRKLGIIKMGTLSVETYLRNIEDIIAQLSAIKHTLTYEELIISVLNGLPYSWGSFVSTFGGELSRTPPPSYGDLASRMLTEELWRAGKITEVEGEANLLSRFRGGHSRSRDHRPFTNRAYPLSSRPVDSGTSNPGHVKSSRRSGSCNYCGKANHWEADCDLKKVDEQIAQLQIRASNLRRHKTQAFITELDADEDYSADNASDHSTEEVEANITQSDQDWFVDSGASSHITGSRRALTNFAPAMPSTSNSSVSTANGARLAVAGQGTVTLYNNKVNKVLYVPGISKNLVSVGKLADHGHHVLFTRRECLVFAKGNSSKICMRGVRDPRNSLYRLTTSSLANYVRSRHSALAINYASPDPEPDPPGSLSSALQNQPLIKSSTQQLGSTTDLWHQRLCHANYQLAHYMSSKHIVDGLPDLDLAKDRKCEICIQAKQHRKSRPKRAVKRTTKILQLLHSDLCGPISSDTDEKYILTITDDYSRFTWVYFLSKKSDTFDSFRNFVTMIEKEFASSVGCVRLRTDRGGEYLSELFTLFLASKGIQRQLTVAGTPHQNGIAERKNRMLLETSRSIFLSARFPRHLRTEAVRTANYVRNRCGTRSLNLSSPYEALTGQKPDVSHFRVIGSTAFIFIPKELRGGKLQPTNYRAILVGYDEQSKAYRLYDPINQHIVISHQVQFLEHQLGNFHANHSPFTDVFAPLFDSVGELAVPLLPQPAFPEAVEDHIALPPQPDVQPVQNLDAPDDPIPEILDPPAEVMPIPAAAVRRYPSRDRRPPSRHHSYYRTDDYTFVVESLEPVCDQISFSEALSHIGWRAAMQEEFDSLLGTGTWELGPLPPDHHALSAKWVFKTKPDVDATRFRLKARLVARGFEQRSGIDFDETFAPVVKWSTLRSVIALSVALGWELHHMDIVTAFLNGILSEPIYMEQPPGFAVRGSEHLVCHLRRSLYGLKQSPRTWYQEIDSYLRDSGWTRSMADPNLYFLNQAGHILILMLFVDDLLITGSSPTQIQDMKALLAKKYKMKDLGAVKKYLGVEFDRTQSGGLFLHLTNYTHDLVKEYHMQNCRQEFTPLPLGLTLDVDTATPAVDPSIYCRVVGKLIFLTHTRPDISHAVGIVSRFMKAPQQAHWDSVSHLLRYISTTADFGIHYSNSGSHSLTGFTDADYLSCTSTQRSIGAYVFTLASGPISWSSKQQATVSDSTTEAEYKALSEGAKEAVYIRRLFIELGLGPALSVPLTIDQSQVYSDLLHHRIHSTAYSLL